MPVVTFRYVTDLDDFASWAIRRAQLGFLYSHVELKKPAGIIIGASPEGEAYLGARMDGGVSWAPKGYDADLKSEEIFVDVPVTADQEKAFWDFAVSQIGAPYDKKIIAGFAAGMFIGLRDWHDPGDWICSEYAAAACEAGAIFKPLPQGKTYITPELHLTALSQVAGVDLPAMSSIEALYAPMTLPRSAV